MELDEMDAVIREHRVDVIRDEFDELAQEVSGDASGGLFVKLGEGEFGSAINRDEEIEFSLRGADLGEIDMKVADGVSLELLLWGRAMTCHVRKAADAMTLEATMQRRAGELRQGGLERVETIVEWKKGVPAKGDHHGLLLGGEGGRAPLFGAHRGILDRGAPAPLVDRLRIEVVASRERSQARLTMLDRPTHCRRRAGAAMKYLSHKI